MTWSQERGEGGRYCFPEGGGGRCCDLVPGGGRGVGAVVQRGG